MAYQSVGKYLDRTKLQSKLRAKYGAGFNFNVQVRALIIWSVLVLIIDDARPDALEQVGAILTGKNS
jgi:hypothetical protein